MTQQQNGKRTLRRERGACSVYIYYRQGIQEGNSYTHIQQERGQRVRI
jgi:hypothetical protein